jgi:hypothetical protein
MDFKLSELFFEEPQHRGRWRTFPFSSAVSLRTPQVCVMQNCLAAHRPATHVKNLTLGVKRGDPESEAFIQDLGKLEEFVARAVDTMYPAWSPRAPQKKQTFVSMYKPAVTKGGMFAGEMRVNIVGAEMKVVDEDGEAVEPADLLLGSFVRADLEVVGVWCSEERFGLKYSVPRVELLRDQGSLM